MLFKKLYWVRISIDGIFQEHGLFLIYYDTSGSLLFEKVVASSLWWHNISKEKIDF